MNSEFYDVLMQGLPFWIIGAIVLTVIILTPIFDFFREIKMKQYNFELICRKCGETITRRLTQFDELPRCNKCDSEMLVENVTTEKENEKCTNQKS